MKVLAIERERPGVTDADFEPHLAAEAARAWELYRDDVIRELYFRADRHEAVLILECANIEQARQVLETLPLVQNRLIDFDLMPLRPYPGFARLFAA